MVTSGYCPRCGQPYTSGGEFSHYCPARPRHTEARPVAPVQQWALPAITPQPKLTADEIRKIVREELERVGMGKGEGR